VTAAGAVLTGGRSARMGMDKALLRVGGQPMARRVATALRGAGVDPVIAVGGDVQSLRANGLDAVVDPRQGGGPLAGLVSALEALTAPVVVVVACDLPDLTSDAVRRVVTALGGADVALGRTDDGLQPLCGSWRRDTCLPALLAAFDGGERAIHRAIAGLRVVEVALPAAALRNVNQPSDLPG